MLKNASAGDSTPLGIVLAGPGDFSTIFNFSPNISLIIHDIISCLKMPRIRPDPSRQPGSSGLYELFFFRIIFLSIRNTFWCLKMPRKNRSRISPTSLFASPDIFFNLFLKSSSFKMPRRCPGSSPHPFRRSEQICQTYSRIFSC